MAKKIAISLAKGGVGKTTTAVNLAAALAQSGRRTLLIDTDTQGQIAGALGVEPELGLAEFIIDQKRQAVIEVRENLYLLAGGISVNKVVQKIRETSFMQHEILKNALEPLEQFFEFILVDTAPSWTELSINVLAYADELLCPVPLEMLAVRGLKDFLLRARPVLERTGGVVRYIVPTMLDRRFAQTTEIATLLEETFGDLLTDPIRSNVRLSEAPAHGETIFEYAPNSKGAEDYQRLAERIGANEQA
jgi:chromosome partitioning protein